MPPNCHQLAVRAGGESLSLDKLRLKTLLGRGGFAAVWLAEYAGQEVAVKVNLPAGAGGTMAVVPQEMTQMFLREAEVTGSLAHRHIIRCLGTLELPASFHLPGLEREGLATRRPEPSAAMVLELCEPTSAKHLIVRAIISGRTKAYSTAQALQWCEQVAEALAYLHRQKPCIIHRDVKQENILFQRRGGGTQLEAKLADLGLHVAIEMDRKVMLRRRSVTAGSSMSGTAAAPTSGAGNDSGVLPSRGPSANGGGGAGATGPSTPPSALASGVKGGPSASQLLPGAAGIITMIATAPGGRISATGAASGSSKVAASPFLTISPGASPAQSRTPSANALGSRPGSSCTAPPQAQAVPAGSGKALLAKASQVHRQEQHEQQNQQGEAGMAVPESPWALGLGLPQEALLAEATAVDAAESGACPQAAEPGSSRTADAATAQAKRQAGVSSGVAVAATTDIGARTGGDGGAAGPPAAPVAAGAGSGLTTFISCTPATSVGVEDVELLTATVGARKPASAPAAAPDAAGSGSPTGGGAGAGSGAAPRPASGKQKAALDQLALPGGASLLPAGGTHAGSGDGAVDGSPCGELSDADRGHGGQGPPFRSPSALRSRLLTPAGPTALVITKEEEEEEEAVEEEEEEAVEEEEVEEEAVEQAGACDTTSAFASHAAAAVAAAAVSEAEGGTAASSAAQSPSAERAGDATTAGVNSAQHSPTAAAATPAAGAAAGALSKARSGSLQQPMAAALLKSRSLKQRASGGPGGGGASADVALVTPFASAVPIATPPGSGGGATPTPGSSAGGASNGNGNGSGNGNGEQGPLPLHTSESLGTMLARRPSLVTPVDSGAARSGLRAVRSLLQQLGKRELRPLRKGDLEWVYGLTGRAGSYMYMAPEVWNRMPYNEKVDVFSFGVVMYELLSRDLLLISHMNTSRAAQLGIKTPADYVAQVSKGYRPPRPARLTSDAAWALISDCWQDDPVQRPDMDTVLVRLRELTRTEMGGGAGGRSSWRRDIGKRVDEEENEAAARAPAAGTGGAKPSDGCRCTIS